MLCLRLLALLLVLGVGVGVGLGLVPSAAAATPTTTTDGAIDKAGTRRLRPTHHGRHRRHPHAAPPPPRLDACYDPGLAAHGFDREHFPACGVLAEGRAQLYWRHDRDADHITLGLVLRSSSSSSNATDGDPAHRWYALGLSAESQGMKGMDVAMLRPAGKGETGSISISSSISSSSSSSGGGGGWVLDDRWATDYALPALDASQDKTLLSVVSLPLAATSAAEEPPGRVVGFTFRMPLAGCGVHVEEHESEDTPILPGRDTFVLWAQGVVDPESGEPQYHGENNGATRLPLGKETGRGTGSGGAGHGGHGGSSPIATDKGKAAAAAPGTLGVALPEDAQVLAITLPEMELPASATKYYCMYVQPPRATKYHIYSARQVGDAGVAKELVHHMGLYTAGTSEPPTPVGEVFDCTVQAGADHGLPIMIIDRGDVSTPSAQAYEAADAAVPFGKGYDEYWLLEVHYNNPEEKAGLCDATGLEVTYSPTLRKHDVGVLVLGAPPHVPQMGFVSPLVVPGGEAGFDYMNFCPPSCTKRRLQKPQPQPQPQQGDGADGDDDGDGDGDSDNSIHSGFHIMYAHLHMHGLGRGGELQLIRNASASAEGWERRRLLHRRHWDFENQQGVNFAPPGVPLYPGDGFLTRCHYDSTAKNTTTIYGQSADDEMCLGLVFVRGLNASVVCVDWEGAHSPGIDALGLNDPTKPNQVALCQSGADYADMVAHPKEATAILTQRGGLAGGPRAEFRYAKEDFDWAPPLEEAVCGVSLEPAGAGARGGGGAGAAVTTSVTAAAGGKRGGKGKKKKGKHF